MLSRLPLHVHLCARCTMHVGACTAYADGEGLRRSPFLRCLTSHRSAHLGRHVQHPSACYSAAGVRREESGGANTFVLSTHAQTYVLQVETAEEMEAWLRVLGRAIVRSTTVEWESVGPVSFLAGRSYAPKHCVAQPRPTAGLQSSSFRWPSLCSETSDRIEEAQAGKR